MNDEVADGPNIHYRKGELVEGVVSLKTVRTGQVSREGTPGEAAEDSFS